MMLCLKWFSPIVILFIFTPLNIQGWHLITTPRRYTKGEDTSICVSLSEAPAADDFLSVSITEETFGQEKTVLEKDFAFTSVDKNRCFRLTVPNTVVPKSKLHITGKLLQKEINETRGIKIAYTVAQTFVQTDKYLYKPSQEVQFRILTVIGPFLELSTDNYAMVWVENPSGSRIWQATEVDNSAGLVHLAFTLADEPEQGTYRIKVSTPYNTTLDRTFKVEDYVLPRYEVTINPPPYVLGTSKEFTFEVCAKYTFGPSVNGNLTLVVDNNGWGENKVTVKRELKISGCHSMNFTSDELAINGENFFAYSLKARASVLEEGTNTLLTSDSKSVSISRNALVFNDVGLQEFLKPELPFLVEITVEFPDESPAKNEPMSVCIRDLCKNYTTNANGLLKFAIPPHISGNAVVRALNFGRIESGNSWRSVMYESNFVKSAKRYHSDSNSSLVIALSEKEIECRAHLDDISLSLPVRFSAVNQTSATIHVQVVSRGQIQFFKAFEQQFAAGSSLHISSKLFLEPPKKPQTKGAVRGHFSIPISLSKTASPKAKVLVWYAREDGEVVSDARTLDISDCLLNDVTLGWSKNKVRPGGMATVKIAAEPKSLCSLGVVDKSVDILSSKSTNQLTIKKLLAIAERASVDLYENIQVNDFEYCRKKENETKKLVIVPVMLPGVDDVPETTTTITKEEITAKDEEDLTRDTPKDTPARSKRSFGWRPFYSLDIDSLHMFDEADVYVFSDYTLESRPCNSHYLDNLAQAAEPLTVQDAGTVIKASANTQEKEGSVDLVEDEEPSSRRTYFPETWLWDLKLLTNETYEEELTLPDTVTEWVGQAVCVHPTEGVGISETSSITTFKEFFVDLTLPSTAKRGEVFPVKISVFNYLDKAIPVKVTLVASKDFEILSKDSAVIGSGERTSCIEANNKVVHSIKIRPTSSGNVNITVDALLDANSVTSCGAGTTEQQRDVVVRQLTVEFEGLPKEETWTEYLCSTDSNGKEISANWSLTVPSEVVPDSVRGWISAVGDLMGPTIDNLGKLVKMPYGCGEQNMLNFAPNIYVIHYIESSNQTSETATKYALEYMKKGYQRELNYRHSDGSYSAFGERDDSGSTWLTAFVLKCFAQARPYITIDEEDLSLSSTWLKTLQMENGCFDSVGKVLHKGLKGGLTSASDPASLSSFVLISLLESGEDPTSRLVREATFCLKADNSSAAYPLALKAYALALAKVPEGQEAIDNLIEAAITSKTSMFWKTSGGKALDVETAAYAVLALINYNSTQYLPQVRMIVKWINNRRNGQGGFISTQDTIVALQALAAFEETTPQVPLDAVMVVDMNPLQESFTLNEANKFLLQKIDIPSIPSDVAINFAGDGCVLTQAVVRYNIPKPEPSLAFKLTVNASTEPDQGCKTKRIEACASYILPDLKSNMAILEIEIMTGYIPDKSDLKQVVGTGKGLVKRYEVDANKVMFYVDEFSSKETCVSFRVLREINVEDAKDGSVTVYDYYKPEYSLSKSYRLPPADECIETIMEEIEIKDTGVDGGANLNMRIFVIPVP